MQIRILAFALCLLAPVTACFANPAVPVQEGAASEANKLPVAIALSISDEIIGMQRKFRANSFSGQTHEFQVNVGQKFGDAIEAATRSLFRDVYTAPAEGMPTIRFELGGYDSNIAMKDGPFSVTADVSTQIALRVTILNAGAKTILTTTAQGDAAISRNAFFSGVGQGPRLVEETSVAAINRALEKLSEVVRRNSNLNYYGTEQGGL